MLKDPKTNQEIKDFLHSHKDLLIMVADPKTDEIVIAYNDQFAVTQYPFESMDKGIVFNALRESKFDETIDPLMVGIEKATGITVENNQQLSHIIGGSIMNIGKKSKLPVNKQKNAKTKKGS